MSVPASPKHCQRLLGLTWHPFQTIATGHFCNVLCCEPFPQQLDQEVRHAGTCTLLI